MIFGRNKKPDNTQTPTAAVPGAAANPVPAQPAAAAPAPTAVSAPAAATSAPKTPEEKELLARRALGAKLLVASFGEIVSILMRSSSYKHFSLADLEWLVIPPVLTRQFVLAEARKTNEDIPAPIAVALWASVSEEVDKKLAATVSGPLRLRPDEWKSGEILWLIDAVGPPQVLEGIINNLHKTVFKGRPLKVRARDEEGKPIIKIQKLPVADGEASS